MIVCLFLDVFLIYDFCNFLLIIGFPSFKCHMYKPYYNTSSGASDIVPLSASFLSSSQNVQLTAATIEPLSSPSSRPSLHSPPPSPPPNVTTHPTTPSSAPQSSTIAEAISSERYGTTSTPTTSSSLRVTSPVSARSPTDYRTSRSLDPSPLSSGAPRERFSPFSGFDWKAGVTAGLGKLLNCAPALAPAGVGDDSSYPRSHFSGGPAVRPMSFFGSGDNDSSIGSTPGGFTVANRTTSPSSAFENNQDAALESEFVRRHARSWQWNDNQGRMHAPLEQQQRPTRGLGAEWWAGVMAEGMAAYESHVPLDGTSSRPRDAAAAAARGVSAAVAAAGNGGGGGSSASPVQAPGRAPGHFEWFETHGDFLNTFWPSPLEQQLCIAPSRARTAWNRSFSASEGVCFPAAPPVLPRVNSRGGVAMPQRTYWSFSREARVLKKLLGGPPTGLPDSAATNIEDISPLERGSSGNSNNGGMKWALCFEDSTYHGDFTSTLHDALHRLPDVDSLSFRAGFQPSAHVGSGGQGGSGGTNSGRSFDNGGSGGVGNRRVGAAADSNTTCLAYLAQDLPLSVRHVTYDGVLSRDAVQILGVALMSRTVHQVVTTTSTLGVSLTQEEKHEHLFPYLTFFLALSSYFLSLFSNLGIFSIRLCTSIYDLNGTCSGGIRVTRAAWQQQRHTGVVALRAIDLVAAVIMLQGAACIFEDLR